MDIHLPPCLTWMHIHVVYHALSNHPSPMKMWNSNEQVSKTIQGDMSLVSCRSNMQSSGKTWFYSHGHGGNVQCLLTRRNQVSSKVSCILCRYLSPRRSRISLVCGGKIMKRGQVHVCTRMYTWRVEGGMTDKYKTRGRIRVMKWGRKWEEHELIRLPMECNQAHTCMTCIQYNSPCITCVEGRNMISSNTIPLFLLVYPDHCFLLVRGGHVLE